jgi:F-type H+-transporting ATPase subunit delta
MIPGTLAKRYARALDKLASSPVQRDKFLGNLEDLTKAATEGDSALLKVLDAAHHPLSKRRTIAGQIGKRLGVDPVVAKFIDLLVERGRVGGLPQITRQFRDIVDRGAGRMRASLRSAKPLPPDVTNRIKAALEQASGKKIILESSVDPELIGGVVAQVGSYTLDRSVKNSLEKLRRSLRGS